MIGDLPETIGRYRVLHELGRGSMARVLLARDPNTDRDVALKVVAEGGEGAPVGQDEARRRFLLEARAAGRLHHPSIVMIYDADVDSQTGCAYMAMEWVRGRSLAELLEERGKLVPREAVAIAADVAAALDHAHGRQVIHRDVKPGNILLGDDGAVKVSDFGIAKFVAESHTLWGQILGSPSYMSPEQVKNEAVDGRSDLFSLAAVVYEMLTGVPPFQGDSVASIVYKIANVDPRPPSLLDPSIGPELDAVVLRALDRDPARRFQTGAELAAALEGALEGDGSAPAAGKRAAPRGAGANGARRSSDGPGVFGRLGWKGVAAVAIVLLAGAVGVALRYGQLASEAAGPDGAPAEPSAEVALPVAEPAAGDSSDPVAQPSEGEPSTPPGEGMAVAEGAEPAGTKPAEPPGSSAPASVPDTAPSPAEAEPSSQPAQRALLRLVHKNRLEDALLTVWIDGDRVLSLRLEGGKGVLGRVAGDEVTTPIPVDPGMHTVEVRITAAKGGRTDARGVLRSHFKPGQTRLLRVVRRPYSDKLKLSWEE